jgi:hypothetical protein
LVEQVERAAGGQGAKQREQEGLAERGQAGGWLGIEERKRAVGVGCREDGAEREG